MWFSFKIFEESIIYRRGENVLGSHVTPNLTEYNIVAHFIKNQQTITTT